MNENTNTTGERGAGRTLYVLDNLETGDAGHGSDLVVDLTGIQALDSVNLALLLTAQRNAQEEDRAVWLAGVPLSVWQALHALGVGHLFKPFPVFGETPA